MHNIGIYDRIEKTGISQFLMVTHGRVALQSPGVGRGMPRLRYDLGGDFGRAGGAAFLSVERRLEFEHRFEEIVLNRAISERSALLVREICLRENELVLRNF